MQEKLKDFHERVAYHGVWTYRNLRTTMFWSSKLEKFIYFASYEDDIIVKDLFPEIGPSKDYFEIELILTIHEKYDYSSILIKLDNFEKEKLVDN